MAVATGSLGRIHRDIGGANQFVDLCSVDGHDGNAGGDG
jgi:hypothetical protein